MPGGHLDNGETPEHTAVRETQEETGLVVANPRFIGFTNDIFPDEPGKHYVTLCVCVDWTAGEPEPTREMGEFRWIRLNDFPEPLFFPLQNLMQSQHWMQLSEDLAQA
jgi:8-oxo-dGTP diphosphatase